MSSTSHPYHIVVRPNQSWFRLDWRGIVEYRDLLFLLVRRDFMSRYKQTILGPSWFIVQPLITTVVYMVVFNKVIGVSTGGVSPALFYLSGLLAWSYFSNLISTTATTFIANANIFGKVYFPRLVVPFALSMSNAISFGIQLGTFLVVLGVNVWTGHFVTTGADVLAAVAVMPLCLLHIALLALGVGLTLASLTAKYRDFQHLISFVVNIWMYVTPIIYPSSRIPAKLAWMAQINPMAPIVELIRSVFLHTAPMPTGSYLLSVATTLIIFLTGVLLFQRTARTFIDII
ncbi:ABC transporter permease [Horticoccus luteus]|uniref:Transport permease protein n=1 Tax=Horticoccus luteus TaxID=2862869 RepID=A0A8F9XMK9_9BACT|nr:ABC transporter permease [Horticoccus luteus]QYM80351.1 ABC transporter permease [Horticoccus luteus]